MSYISFYCNGVARGQQELFFQGKKKIYFGRFNIFPSKKNLLVILIISGAHTDKYYAIQYPGGQVELVYNNLNELFFFDNFGSCKSIIGVKSRSNAGMVVGIIFGIIVFIGLAIGGYMYYRNRIGTGYTQL